MPNDGWFHVVVTRQQGYGTKLYIDVELVDTQTHQYIKPGPARDSPRLVLGASYPCYLSYQKSVFESKLDELRIRDTVIIKHHFLHFFYIFQNQFTTSRIDSDSESVVCQ